MIPKLYMNHRTKVFSHLRDEELVYILRNLSTKHREQIQIRFKNCLPRMDVNDGIDTDYRVDQLMPRFLFLQKRCRGFEIEFQEYSEG